jgi:hypothetical protein
MQLQRFRRTRVTAVFICITMAATVAAQVTAKPDAQAQREVIATDERRIDALRRGDPNPLREIYADDYTLIAPVGATIRSKTDQINELTGGRLKYGRIDVSERTVRIYGDTAIVVQREKIDILLDGKQMGGDVRFTRTYKRLGNEWRVIATHGTTVVP